MFLLRIFHVMKPALNMLSFLRILWNVFFYNFTNLLMFLFMQLYLIILFFKIYFNVELNFLSVRLIIVSRFLILSATKVEIINSQDICLSIGQSWCRSTVRITSIQKWNIILLLPF